MEPRVRTFSSEEGFDTRPEITTMLSPDEKGLYYEIARGYTGAGSVVEVGPWLGSGTWQICRGLSESGHDWRLTVIDRFRWSELYERRYPQVGLTDGDEFLSVFRRNMGIYSPRIDAVETELTDLPKVFAAPDQIELLYIDAPKSWTMCWMILNTFGPKLLPGARLVFQDYLHITSRQLIWLLSFVKELRLTDIVDKGTSVAFVADGPITDLEKSVPSNMVTLSPASLIAQSNMVAAMLPDARAGEIAVGAALDLLDVGAVAEAEQVLAGKARDKPWTGALIQEIDRLIRHSIKKYSEPLSQIRFYLAGDLGLAESKNIWRAREAEERRQLAAAAPDPLEALSGEQLLAVAKAIKAPETATGLALRYTMDHPSAKPITPDLRGLFDAAVRSGAFADAGGLEGIARGKDVVTLEKHYSLRGVILRALGARRVTSVLAGLDPGQRTYHAAGSKDRLRTNLRVGNLPAVLPGVEFVDSAERLAPSSADLIVVEIDTIDEARAAVETAGHALRPGGSFCVRWRNRRSWAGHGRAPQRVADIDRNDPAQAGLLDWRHVRGISENHPTPQALREALAWILEIERWDTRLGDPGALGRITPKVLAANPGLSRLDLVTDEFTAIGRLKQRAG
jgi:hypothetical protein